MSKPFQVRLIPADTPMGRFPRLTRAILEAGFTTPPSGSKGTTPWAHTAGDLVVGVEGAYLGDDGAANAGSEALHEREGLRAARRLKAPFAYLARVAETGHFFLEHPDLQGDGPFLVVEGAVAGDVGGHSPVVQGFALGK